MLNKTEERALWEGAKSLNIELSDEALARLTTYLEELLRWSSITDLVSQSDPEQIIRKHLLDSLAISALIPSECRLLDLGSGAGFPGIPLAILEPGRNVALIEARRKRVSFLREATRKMQLANVRIYEGRAEILADDSSLRASFDVVISRATWNLEDFLRITWPFLKERGIAIAMKGPRIEKELATLESGRSIFGFHLQEISEYCLPFGKEKRCVAIFSKLLIM